MTLKKVQDSGKKAHYLKGNLCRTNEKDKYCPKTSIIKLYIIFL